MSVECTSCGHAIPAGQFRCGKCGAAQTRDSLEDYAGVVEAVERAETRVRAEASNPSPARAGASSPLGTGPENGRGTGSMKNPLAKSETRGEARERMEARDEDPARESSVPKGTFASAAPESAETRARTESKPETPHSPPESREHTPPKVEGEARSSASSSQRKARAPAQPPFLASEILREDLAPSEPGNDILVRVLQIASALGLASVFLSGLGSIPGLFVGVICVSLIVLSRMRMSYAVRASAAGIIAGVALGVVALWRVALGGRLHGAWLAFATTSLAAALLFRAWYRASNSARALVGVALALAFAWAAATGHRGLLSLAFEWESWLPALTWYVFVLLCLLSLLAFMGDETTGGCNAWAALLLGWYGVYAAVRWALDGNAGDPSGSSGMAVLGLAEPAFAAPAAVALAQLLARVIGPRARRAAHTEHTLAGMR